MSAGKSSAGGKGAKASSASASSRSSGKNSFSPVFWSLALAPALLFGLMHLALHFGTSYHPSASRPPIVVLPFLGFSFLPAALFLARFLWRSRLPTGLNAIKNLLVFAATAAFLLHNGLTVLYGNINNDAWSDSLMIDVIAPPEFFRPMERISSKFHLATNPATWAHTDIINGPHLDIPAVHAAADKCGPRTFSRFMFHSIRQQSRVSALLIDGVMFGGHWAMVEGDDR